MRHKMYAKLNEELDAFLQKISKIMDMQSFVKHITDEQLKQIAKQINRRNSLGSQYKKIFGTTFSSHFYDCSQTGETLCLAHYEHTLEKKRELLYLARNKQYQWLLVDAFEEFENFLITFYAIIGFNFHHLWPAKDFGNIKIQEIKSKNEDWFIQQTKKNHKNPTKTILSWIRNNTENLEQEERICKKGILLPLSICIVEQFRHTIVHCNGIISDQNAIEEKILKDSGLYNNSSINNDYKRLIQDFYGTYNDELYVFLIEEKDRKHSRDEFTIFHCRFSLLISTVINYAKLIHKNLNHAFSDSCEPSCLPLGRTGQ